MANVLLHSVYELTPGEIVFRSKRGLRSEFQ